MENTEDEENLRAINLVLNPTELMILQPKIQDIAPFYDHQTNMMKLNTIKP
ncbi:hypothetical protein DERP_015158 [Dermatophagoides pteronyssinus]|uniref:Uncharacterized protein n=1 Tax=Dermatophagoides pteronyssinus TaxID=6956 RepID=A0ABQ8JTL5_DERPT|nr:hypothetical protein DERP_015158 [Dermatophagoides pteronyssinus]